MKVSILGAGSFGSAIAKHVSESGENEVLLWSRDRAQVERINTSHDNPGYLPEACFPDSVSATQDIAACLRFSQSVVIAIPTQAVREVLREAAASTPTGESLSLLNLAKGIEIETGNFLHQTAREILPQAAYAALSGPSHAEEVALGKPTAVVVASAHPDVAKKWQGILNNERLRIYTSDDIPGVELGGALKNVIAIAVGAARAAGFGDNSVAALVTRGLAEIMRYGAAMGVNPLTLAGLAGVGDLMVTCYSNLSRNFRFGAAIGKGLSPEQAAAEIGQVVEGMYTAKALVAKARKEGVELPLSEAVHAILYEGRHMPDIVSDLLFREPKPEIPAIPHRR